MDAESAYRRFFRELTGNEPFPYQMHLATAEELPGVLRAPTGAGKTAAVLGAWLFRRRHHPVRAVREATPRRLVYCLPMRVLVEQTARCGREWLAREPDGDAPREVALHVLMGGAEPASWAARPEDDAVLIGTQDMLLSRALNRGYAMSRYAWPAEFALLHADTLWVYDEVQLMGPGLLTSVQLEGLRRRFGSARPTRSLWLSATVHPDWLQGPDLPPGDHGSVLELADSDRTDPALRPRLEASKPIRKAGVRLDPEGLKQQAAGYLAALAVEIRSMVRPGTDLLVVLNTVERAQLLHGLLRRDSAGAALLLVHSRFRPADRRAVEEGLRLPAGQHGRIVVATQAIEAGLDVTSRALVTELAPWSSIVQRMGRCNRRGECTGEAEVRWVDIAPDCADGALPYAAGELAEARSALEELTDARPDRLPGVGSDRPVYPALRARDVLDLFNTDPDLSGFDTDVSQFIRDADDTEVRVFWRRLDGEADEPAALPPVGSPGQSGRRDSMAAQASSPEAGAGGSPGPGGNPERAQRREERRTEVEAVAAELCPVALGQIRRYLEKKLKVGRRDAWLWDPLAERWASCPAYRIRPGLVLLLDAAHGGYSAEVGFQPDLLDEVAPVTGDGPGPAAEGYRSDPLAVAPFVRLTDHLAHVEQAVRELTERVAEPLADLLCRAARWHDVGKAHPVFQATLVACLAERDSRRNDLWAKSQCRGGRHARFGFRHELVSALAYLGNAPACTDSDLVAYLVAAHHGRVRLGIRSLPGEAEAPEGRRFARGIWEGDRLPPVPLPDGTEVPATEVSLELMELGGSADQPSWAERTRRLLDREGPFRLAWWETLLRVADWQASAAEREEGRDA